HRRLPLSHSRAVRHRRYFGSRPLPRRSTLMSFSFDPIASILLIPIGGAVLLTLLPGYWITARLNVIASALTMLSALSLFAIERPEPGQYFLIDDLNIVFIVLNTVVGFT